ncbi:MAG: 4Fe-4S dicluster domain-containing protein [Acidobacteria bacterium]|nr:4Fe-4S dicluster domain-containing protein [Acidobacteriota bacterium]
MSNRSETADDASASSSGAAISEELVDRRSALKYLGLGLAGAVPLAVSGWLMDGLIREVVAGPEPGSPPTVRVTEKTESGRVRQWTMIIDLKKCDGCQSQGTPPQCTTACIEGHFAPDPMEWIEVYEAELSGGGTQFIPTPCQQCENPPCVKVCPVGATFSTPEGTVLIDQDRCIGCRICMAACPYDRRFFNWGTPPVPPEAALADYNPDQQTPASRGTVMKCDFCPEMVRGGTLPFCVQACPNDAIWYGDFEEDIATNGRQIVKASRLISERNGYRLQEHLGTQPRVYYLPGHGEDVGRDPAEEGRMPTKWPWIERAEGAVTWTR